MTNRQADEETAAAGALLRIDLDALADNYRTLAKLAAPAECAGVVKADGYGIGIAEAASALHAAGCRSFFTALLGEARKVLAATPGVRVFVLNGLFPGTAAAFNQSGAIPVLNSLAEISEWGAFARSHGRALPAAIHVDSGINRLGLSEADVAELAASPALADIELVLVMSHLACADEPDSPMNAEQLARFTAMRAKLPAAPASLANSGGIMLGADYGFDMVRAGVALYGGNPQTSRAAPTLPVVELKGRIAQIREVEAGETVGYGATFTFARASRIAIISLGYGDGYFRVLGRMSGGDGAFAWLGDREVAVVGRVSMDSLALDITDIDPALAPRGGLVELIGHNISIDTLAAKAGTIGYEVLTSLGSRYARIYSGSTSNG